MESLRSEHRVAEEEYRDHTILTKPERRPWPWYAAAVVLFVADRLLKATSLSGAGRRLLPFAEFTLFRNGGIAFSLPLNDTIFWVLAVPVFGALLWLFSVATRKRRTFVSVALLFIVLGAASNLADRLLYHATIDYFLFFNRSAVNIADGMIVGGVLALIIRRKQP